MIEVDHLLPRLIIFKLSNIRICLVIRTKPRYYSYIYVKMSQQKLHAFFCGIMHEVPLPLYYDKDIFCYVTNLCKFYGNFKNKVTARTCFTLSHLRGGSELYPNPLPQQGCQNTSPCSIILFFDSLVGRGDYNFTFSFSSALIKKDFQ